MKNALLSALVVALVPCSFVLRAQDATSTLNAAIAAMGADAFASVQYAGSGATYFFGQAANATAGWPRMVLKTYVADVHYTIPAMRQELYRTELDGGVPFGGNRQIQVVSGGDAWNVGANDQPAAAPATAAERRLQIWLTPHGFLRAARANRATVTTTGGDSIVAFTTADRFRVSGIINAQHLVERVDTTIDNVVLGDMPVEVAFSNYRKFGALMFPTSIVQRQGGHPVLDLTVTDVKPDGAAPIEVPASVRGAIPPAVRVQSQPVGTGVWHITGGSHHSVLAEFADYVAIVEAPQNDERSAAVIAEARRLVPGKPIRYVINTHQHFDHSGGLRGYAAAGATILAPSLYKPYYERVFAAPHTINPDALAKSGRQPAIEAVDGRRDLTDRVQALELHVLRGSPHNDALLVAYFPRDKMLVQADVFTPPPSGAATPARPDPLALNLYENIERLKLDVEKIVPIHGRIATFDELRTTVGR